MTNKLRTLIGLTLVASMAAVAQTRTTPSSGTMLGHSGKAKSSAQSSSRAAIPNHTPQIDPRTGMAVTVAASGPTAKCAPGTHFHNPEDFYQQLTIKDGWTYATGRMLPGDGLCHVNAGNNWHDEVALPRTTPKPKFKPNKKAVWA